MNKKSLMSESMLENLLASLLHFMASSGMSRKQIEAAFSVCMQELSRPKGSKKWEQMAAPRVGDETVESAVLRLWHRTSRYLDSDAQPVPLKLYGRSPSVEALVRMQGASVNPRLVIRGLQSVGLIFRTSRGLYLPAQDSATIRQLHRLSVEHVGKSVMRLLGTVLRNTDPSQARTPLIERSARVPDLDAAKPRPSRSSRSSRAWPICSQSTTGWRRAGWREPKGSAAPQGFDGRGRAPVRLHRRRTRRQTQLRSRSARRRIFPTFVFGSSFRK